MAKKNLATITVAGYLGKEAEGRYTQAGKLVTETSIAVNQWDESVDWWRLTLWGDRWQNVTQYLNKGQQIVITGRPIIQKWNDKEGNERLTPTIEVSELELIGKATEDVPF